MEDNEINDLLLEAGDEDKSSGDRVTQGEAPSNQAEDPPKEPAEVQSKTTRTMQRGQRKTVQVHRTTRKSQSVTKVTQVSKQQRPSRHVAAPERFRN
jgi:hypothetical protein